MNYSIENDILKVEVNDKGAELDSLWHKKHQLEYLWDGNPAFWAKKSPILFPIVGTLKDGEFLFEEKAYKLGRHGFARDKVFSLSSRSALELEFSIKSDEQSLNDYPFAFQFHVTYRLIGDELEIGYRVLNSGNQDMYFSVGGHPAFKLPIVADTVYSDYYLEFANTENAGRWPISPDGLIETAPHPLLNSGNRLPLTKELFEKDAIVFKNLNSESLTLRSDKTAHGIACNFPGFPYLGIWAAKGADFICIEPWCGIADSVAADKQLATKEGINKLSVGERFKRTWTIRPF